MAITPKAGTFPFVLHAEGSGVYQTITAGDRTFAADAYPAFGGRDSAPSPLLYALAALSSCNQVTASLVARELGITLGQWRFDVQGDLDTGVFVNGEEGHGSFDTVTILVTVETDATDEQLATLASEVERRCPVSQLIKRSGTPLSSTWTKTDLRPPG